MGRFKIRVGGSLGKLGDKVKRGAGKALSSPLGKFAATALFGPAGGTIAGAAGDVLDTSDGKFNIGRAAGRAALDYGVGKTAQLLGAGAGKLGVKVSVPQPIQNLAAKAGALGSQVGSKVAGMVPKPIQSMAIDALKSKLGIASADDGPRQVDYGSPVVKTGTPPMRGEGGTPPAGGTSWLDKLLAVGTVAAGTEDAIRRRGMENKAMQYAQQPYDARAPLRDRALKLLSTEQPKPDLSPIFSDPGNPYDVQRRQRMAAGGM